MPEDKGRFITKFAGRSMQPTLKEGMLVMVEKIGPLEVKLADIILYQNGNSLIAHRLIRVFKQDKRRIFVTKGDNQAYIDVALISEEALIGRIRAAFYENEPQKNILIKNRLIDGMYVIIGNLLLWIRRNRELVPRPLRAAFKPFVGGSFLAFKKTTHFLYSFFQR